MRILAFLLEPVAIHKILTHIARHARLVTRDPPRSSPAAFARPPVLYVRPCLPRGCYAPCRETNPLSFMLVRYRRGRRLRLTLDMSTDVM